MFRYYAYLPALLVYNDLNLDFVARASGKFSDRLTAMVCLTKFAIICQPGQKTFKGH